MAEPRDYLNPSELREMAEIDADRAEYRRRLNELRLRKQRLRQRGANRMEAARVATGGPN